MAKQSKAATGLLTFLQEALPVYGTINFQANKLRGDVGKAPVTIGSGSDERYVWVHGSYAPRRLEGMPRLDSLITTWNALGRGDYIEAINELVAAKLVQQRAVKGGYVVALQSDLDSVEKEEPTSKAESFTSFKDMARMLKARK